MSVLRWGLLLFLVAGLSLTFVPTASAGIPATCHEDNMSAQCQVDRVKCILWTKPIYYFLGYCFEYTGPPI
jgi:hypothetical protein